jgi:hypothetical protein
MSIFDNETMKSFGQDVSGSITTDNYPDAIKALSEQHRPSRMPFFVEIWRVWIIPLLATHYFWASCI